MEYSLYLVGSKARGDDNSLSDIDYVCIYEKIKPTLNLPQNSSVSYYSVNRMNWMVQNSKLFVKHILMDGIPVVENPNHAALLASFKLDRDILNCDLNEFVNSLCNLKWIPSGISGRRWACDYIYTIARNIIYISNAIDGIFHFGYDSAVEAFLQKRHAFDLAGNFSLMKYEKYKYRAGEQEGISVDRLVIEKVAEILTGRTITVSIGGQSSFKSLRHGSYEFLRLIERAIINGELRDNGYINKLKNHGEYYFTLRQLAYSLLSNRDELSEVS
jgi:hypothetical protein